MVFLAEFSLRFQDFPLKLQAINNYIAKLQILTKYNYISLNSIRGQLSSTIQTCFYSGVVAGYVCGAYMDYETNPLVMSIVPVIFLIIFWFIPSSPQHLLKCNRIEVKPPFIDFQQYEYICLFHIQEAERSLNFYRNAKNSGPEKKAEIEKEFAKLQKIAKINESEPNLRVSDFCRL